MTAYDAKGLVGKYWKAAMLDRAATNTLAIKKIQKPKPVGMALQVLRAACLSHTFSHVGEKFETPHLDKLMKPHRKAVMHPCSARLLYRPLPRATSLIFPC